MHNIHRAIELLDKDEALLAESQTRKKWLANVCVQKKWTILKCNINCSNSSSSNIATVCAFCCCHFVVSCSFRTTYSLHSVYGLTWVSEWVNEWASSSFSVCEMAKSECKQNHLDAISSDIPHMLHVVVLWKFSIELLLLQEFRIYLFIYLFCVFCSSSAWFNTRYTTSNFKWIYTHLTRRIVMLHALFSISLYGCTRTYGIDWLQKSIEKRVSAWNGEESIQ